MEVKTIREIRLAREISQEEMAKRCDVHVNTYMNWEKKPYSIPVGKAKLICKIFDVNIADVSF